MAGPPEKDEIDLAAQQSVRDARERTNPLDGNGLDLLFREARSFNGWKDEPISGDDLKAIYDLAKMGPTSANCCPLRIKFVTSPEAKEKFAPVMFERNRAKTRQAPAVAIFGMDHEFFHKQPQLTPFRPDDIPNRMKENPDLIPHWASQNATLQAAYFMMAVRAAGYDTGPMQGLDKAMCDEVFWAGTAVKTLFVCSIGRGDENTIFKRNPRLPFDDACEIL